MKKHMKPFAVLCAAAITLASCTKEVNETEQVSDEAIAKISALGFNTSNVQKVDEGYLVEGDIIIPANRLDENPEQMKLRIAEVEQYRTTNTVKGLPRVITVSTTDISGALSSAVDAALARYNAENLQITFQRVPSGGDINIKLVKTRQYIASAGFPTNQGDPYHEVKYSAGYANYSAGFMTTVVAHELGHCIGFRHTDYMNRAYSCGSGGNEGASTVGAVHIPGTPTGPDAASWMLACLSSSTNRPFNSNDKIALGYLY